ncbi:MAG TPA: hypothetical protein VFF06_12160 [Polyangia bacterium]|nr:hypothetical protein [Polyangia bacterium]
MKRQGIALGILTSLLTAANARAQAPQLAPPVLRAADCMPANTISLMAPGEGDDRDWFKQNGFVLLHTDQVSPLATDRAVARADRTNILVNENAPNVSVVIDHDGRWVYCKDGIFVAREFGGLFPYSQRVDFKTNSFFQAHHVIQDEWAREVFRGFKFDKKPLYSKGAAPTILLLTRGKKKGGLAKGSNHQAISDKQNERNADPNKKPIAQRTYRDELNDAREDFTPAIGNIPPDVTAQVFAELDSDNSYYCQLWRNGAAELNKSPQDPNYTTQWNKLAAIFVGSPCKAPASANATASGGATSSPVVITQNATYNNKSGVRFNITNIQVTGMIGKKVHTGFNIKHGDKWVRWTPYDIGEITSDPQTLPDLWFFYPYDELRAQGQLDQSFVGWFYVVASETKVDLLERGPNEFRVDPAPAAAPPPAQPAVYSYTNPAGTVSVQLTDGTADRWGTLTGHGTLTFFGARFDCQLIVERHEVYNSDPKTYDYASNVKPGPECAPPHRFTGVDGVADFQAQDFYSYPNGGGLLYLRQTIAAVNIGGLRAQASRPVDLQVAADGPSHVAFFFDNDLQYGRFQFAPGFLSLSKDGAELKMSSGNASIDGQEAKGLMSIRWTRQSDGYHLQYGFGSEWTAKLPQYGVH